MGTVKIGEQIIKLDAIGSTNDYAAKFIAGKTNVPEGTVVAAKNQYSGKGRRGGKWVSPPGMNLTFSIILYPKFLMVEKQFLLSKTISLGIRDYLLSLAYANMSDNRFDVFIKWPNDIYAGDKKICGILIENNVTSSSITSSIAGIGININQTSFPDEIPNPTSVKLLIGKHTGLNLALGSLCSFINTRYLQLMAGDTITLDRDYESAMYLYGIYEIYKIKGKEIRACISGVDEYGALKFKDERGMVII